MAALTARFAWERAVLDSELPPHARLVALTLATSADADMSIPERFSPSLTTLARRTGLSRSSVAKYLNTLERDGWVSRARPSVAAARTLHERTGYGLHMPAGATEDGEASASDGPALVREADQASAPHGLGLVREADQASAPGGHNHLSPSPAITGGDAPPRFPAQCPKHQDHEHTDPCGACGRARRAHERTTADARTAAAADRARTAARLTVARRDGDECEHGQPGGETLHPTSGEPLCPLCRTAARRAAS